MRDHFLTNSAYLATGAVSVKYSERRLIEVGHKTTEFKKSF